MDIEPTSFVSGIRIQDFYGSGLGMEWRQVYKSYFIRATEMVLFLQGWYFPSDASRYTVEQKETSPPVV